MAAFFVTISSRPMILWLVTGPMLAFWGQRQAILSVISGSLARSAGFRCSRIVKMCRTLLGLFPQRNVFNWTDTRDPRCWKPKICWQIDLNMLYFNFCCWDIILYWLLYWLFLVVNLLLLRTSIYFVILTDDIWMTSALKIKPKNWKHFSCLLFLENSKTARLIYPPGSTLNIFIA